MSPRALADSRAVSTMSNRWGMSIESFSISRNQQGEESVAESDAFEKIDAHRIGHRVHILDGSNCSRMYQSPRSALLQFFAHAFIMAMNLQVAKHAVSDARRSFSTLVCTIPASRVRHRSCTMLSDVGDPVGRAAT